MQFLAAQFNWYGFLIGCGMLIGIVLAYLFAKWRGYDTDNVFDLAVVGIPCGVIGARAYFVINSMIETGRSWSFMRIIGFEDGKFVGLAGLAIFGGILGGIIGGIIVRFAINKRKPLEKQMTFIQMLDLAIIIIMLGQCIGRWGNFANSEAYGNVVPEGFPHGLPFSVYIEHCSEAKCNCGGSGYHYATFFYESIWNFVGVILLSLMYNGRRKSFDGFTTAGYCIWYGTIRFMTEYLRVDNMMIGPYRINRIIAAIIFFVGIGIIVNHIICAKRAGKKPFILVDQNKMGYDYYGYERTFFPIAERMRVEKNRHKI